MNQDLHHGLPINGDQAWQSLHGRLCAWIRTCGNRLSYLLQTGTYCPGETKWEIHIFATLRLLIC